MNLAITGLMTNAYLYTGDEQYHEWVVEYVDAWRERTAQNGGILPDNVGPSVELGECIDGKWYGGMYGWTWPHGWRSIGAALAVATTNATLLTGEDAYADVLRSQLKVLLDHARIVGETAYVPYKHGDAGRYEYDAEHKYVRSPYGEDVLRDEDGAVYWSDGWFEFKPHTDHELSAQLWHATRADRDATLFDGLAFCKESGTALYRTQRKDRTGYDPNWFAYQHGRNPSYPEAILRLDHRRVADRLAFIRRDNEPPAAYDDEYLQHRNPVATEGLVHCVFGAPHLVYNGGLQQATVRPFDGDRRRPGLPRDVATLVTDVSDGFASVRAVNLGAHTRELWLQAGAFGEHRFEHVVHGQESPERATTIYEVDAATVRIRLPGCTRVRLDCSVDRFANDPSYAFPWH